MDTALSEESPHVSTLLMKVWWRFEALLEKWKCAMAQENEEYDPRWPPDVPRPKFGPYQVVLNTEPVKPSEQAFLWKVLATVTAGLIMGSIGFIGGATWSHNTRITTLETYRMSDKEGRDKLERRVDSLESRITR